MCSSDLMPVVAQLPARAAGLPVQLRWNFAFSSADTNGTWYVDSVAITEPECLPPVTNPSILNPRLERGNLMFDIQTVASRIYQIEYKTNVQTTAWLPLRNLTGDGTTQTVSVPVNEGDQRFLRFTVQ